MRNMYLQLSAEVTEAKDDHVWVDKYGEINGALQLSQSWLTFHDPAQARQFAAAAITLAERMEKTMAESPEYVPDQSAGEPGQQSS